MLDRKGSSSVSLSSLEIMSSTSWVFFLTQHSRTHMPIDTDGFRKRVKGLLLRGTSGESHAAGMEIKANLSLRGMAPPKDRSSILRA